MKNVQKMALAEWVPVELRLVFAGGMSGVITYTCIAPIERVKILLQVQGMKGATKYNGIVNTMMTVVKEEGVLGLWRGNAANVARVVPNYGERMFQIFFLFSLFVLFVFRSCE